MQRQRSIPALGLLLLFCLTPLRTLAEGLVINEFLAGNSSGFVDEDNDSSDWIEIYNNSTNGATLSLTDLYLTDDANDLTKWRFPVDELAPGQFRIVFASNKGRSVAGQELHTNFRLSGGGEYLALVDGDGFTVLYEYAPVYPPQQDNISYGISTNDTQEHRYFSIPTPGQANSGEYEGIVEDTKFSIDRGIYDEAFDLSITSATLGAIIRYTLDGSTPSEVQGTIYTGPLLIDKTTVVRAVAYKTGFRTTDVDTQTYIFIADVITQPTMLTSITESPIYGPLMEDALTAIPTISIVTPNTINQSAEVKTSVEMIFPDGTKGFHVDTGIKDVGGASVGFPKKSMRLYFRSKYGYGTLKYPLFEGHPYSEEGPVEKFDQLTLRSSHDSVFYLGASGQYLRNRWISDMQFRMGQISLHGRFVHVYINGVYWGQYHLIERQNDEFFAGYLGGTQDDYEGVNAGRQIGSNPLTMWNHIKASLADYEEEKRIVDMNNLADYMLLNHYAGNADWNYAHNWGAGGPNKPDWGGYKFFSWDSDLIFLNVNYNNMFVPVPEGVYHGLRQHADFQLLVADRMYKHCFNGGALTPAVTQETYDFRANQIYNSIVAESARWNPAGNWTRDNQWLNFWGVMQNTYFPFRTDILIQQYRSAGWYNFDPPEFNQNGGLFGDGFSLSMTSTQTVYYTLDGSDPREAGTGAPIGLLYSNAVPLTHTVLVKARAYVSDTQWSAVHEALFIREGASDLRVTEIMYNPRDPQGIETNAGWTASDFEYIEIRNLGAKTAGLVGTKFTEGITFDFTDSDVDKLEPGEGVVVVRNQAAFATRYGTAIKVAGQYQPFHNFPVKTLSNGGELVMLVDPLGSNIASFVYDDSRGWPLAADGAGHSLVPLITDDQSNGALDYGLNWRPSTYLDGSPGEADPPSPDTLLINEIIAHTDYNNPSYPEYDSNDSIELFNSGPNPVSLANWYLSDNGDNLKKWAIPPGDTVLAGAWIEYDEVTGFHSPITNGFGLNKAADEVFLSYLPGTSEDRIVDCLKFKGQANGQSLGRFPDGGPWWYALAPTRNAANATPSFDVVISEIMYHPRATPDSPGDNSDDEYIEIRNLSGSAVPFLSEGENWRIDGGVSFTFPDGFSLPAGGYVVVAPFDPTNATDRTPFLNAYGLTNNEVQIVGPFSGKLSNRGERVALERPQAPDDPGDKVSWIIVDEAIYFDQAPWPPEADGTGQPLVRGNTQRSGNNAANWVAGFWSSPGFLQPAFRISVPNFSETVLLGTTVPAAAEFDDSVITGSISGVEFFLDGISLGVDATAPYEWSLGPLTNERTYALTATLSGSDGVFQARAVVVSVSTVNNAGGATEIGITGARLNGEISNAGSADVRIYWGDTDGGTDTNAWQHVIDEGRKTDGFGESIFGLLANGRYYYRCQANNAYGTIWAASSTNFVTHPPQIALTLQGDPIFESGSAATVRATLSRLSAEDVTAGLAFSGEAVYGSDYVASSNAILVPAGQESATITVTGLDDPDVESVESIIIDLGALLLGATGTPSQVSATLISDDPRVINAPADNITDSSARAGGNLTHGYGSEVFVYWGTVDGGTTKTSWASATPVGTSPEGPFTATLTGLKADQTYFFRCYALNAGGEDWADDTLNFHTDPPSLSIDDTITTEGHSGLTEAVFTVRLSAVSALPITVHYATSDDTALAPADYLAKDGTLLIAAGQPSGQITVSVQGDTDDEWPSERFVVTLDSPTDSTLADASAYGVIQDDDVAVTLAPWLYRVKISFPGYQSGEALQNFPALIVLGTNVPNFAYGQFTSGNGSPQDHPWSSLRFANSNITALLNFDVERWDTNGNSHVWVQIPELVGTNAFIWAYWGQANATNSPSFSTNGAAWSEGYRGVWHMASSDARDATSLGHHGTSQGSVTHLSDGLIAGANAFDADNDYIAVPDSDDFNFPNDYTLSAWLYSDDIGNQDEGFVGTYNGNGFMFSLQNDTPNTLRLWTSGSWRSSDTSLQEARWTHVAYTRKGAVGRFYIDGVLVRDRTDAVAINDGGELQLGGAGTSWAGNRFDGMIDEVRLASAARSSNWIWACWFNQASNELFSSFGEVEAADTDVPSLFVIFGATNITDTSACLTARLTSTGTAETAVWIYWGPDDGGQTPENWAFTNAFGTVTRPPFIDYSYCAQGLQANTAYHYAYRASNSNGTTWSIAHFSAVGGPEVANIGGGTNAGVGTITLRGRLLNSSPADVTVYWGTTDAGSNKLAWTSSTALGTKGGNAAFGANISGLLYGVRYYYRSYVTNSYGEDWADTATSFLSLAPDAEALAVRNGLVLWLDARDVDADGTLANNPADGSSVNIWRDRSGRGHDADNVDSGAPSYRVNGLNGNPVLEFDGSSYLYTTYNFDELDAYSIFTMARYTGGDSERIIGSRTHNWFFGFWGNTDERWYAEGWIYGAGSANTDWHLHAGTMNDDPDPAGGFWKDGFQLTENSRGSHDSVYKPGLLGLGGGNGPNSEGSRCEIAEVLIFDRVLDSDDMDAVGSYLSRKYDLDTGYSGDAGGIGVGVHNGDASNITAHAALLTGTLSASGSVFEVWLHWGDEDAGPGGSWDQSTFMGSYTNMQEVPLAHPVAALAADTPYYYTFSAHNEAGDSWDEPASSFYTRLSPNDFIYKMQISFTGLTNGVALTNFPALLRFNADNGFYDGFASPDGYDLRFTSLDGTRLSHEYDSAWDRFGESTVWVGIPLLTNGVSMWAYWGNVLLTAEPAFATDASIWADGFKTVWHMNDPNAQDSSGRGHHGVAQGPISKTSGMIGQACEFNPGGYVSVPASTDFRMYSDDFTMSAWVYSHNNIGEHGIFGTWGNQFIFGAINGVVAFHANGQVFWPSVAPIALNDWSYITITRRDTSWRVYVDGVLHDSNPQNGGVRSIDGYQQLEIGSGGPGWHAWWDGLIDEPRIESKWRSPAWVAASYSNQVQGSTFVTMGPDIRLVNGIANQPASGILANEATLNALLYSKGTSYYATVYWGPTDGGTEPSAWANTNALGILFTNTGMTNISYHATAGVSDLSNNYFAWRVTNGTHSAWAQPSGHWAAEREWVGTLGDLWSTPGNWRGDNVPDVAAESTLFAGAGAGNVDLDGRSFTNSAMVFTQGDYALVDTNANAGILKIASLLNAGGENRINVGMTVTGTVEVSGGTLCLDDTSSFDAGLLLLNGGALSVRGGTTSGTAIWDFESGDLSGWTQVPTSFGDDSLFNTGSQPVQQIVHGGAWSVVTYHKHPSGSSDGYTGIIETVPFTIKEPGTISFWITAGQYPLSGDPDSPNANMTGFALERKVAPGDWEMLETRTHAGHGWDWQNQVWDTTPYLGNTVRLRIYDTSAAGWGHTGLDDIIATGVEGVGTGPVDLTDTPLHVLADSSLRANSATNVARLGALTISNATLKTSGNALGFLNTTIPPSATSVGIDATVDTTLTQSSGMSAPGATATFVKTGLRHVILDRAGNALANILFEVREGGLVGVHANAFGAAALSLNGGELILSSPGGNISYPNHVPVVTNSTLTAGRAGGGIAGPLTARLNGDILFNGWHTLTARATDNYTLRLAGQISGNGSVNLTGGSVIIDDPSFNAVVLNGGTLIVSSNMTVNAFIHNSGKISMSGGSKSLTVTDTLTLSGALDFSGGPELDLNSSVVTLNNGTVLTYDKALSADAIEIKNGATLRLGTNALNVGTLTWRNGGTLDMTGPITIGSAFSVWPQRSIANRLLGPGDVYIGDPSDSWGYVQLSGTNTYAGKTQIRRAVLQAHENIGMPTNSLLVFRAEGYDQHCVLETYGSFQRNIGQAAGEVYWDATGVGGGWSAREGDLIVTLEGAAPLSWNDANLGFNNRQTLMFGSEYADSMVELRNAIDFNSDADRRIHIQNNPALKTDLVRLSGTLSGSGAWNGSQLRFGEGRDRNFRNALFELTGTNTYTRRTVIRGGALYAIDGIGIPTNSTILFQSADSVNDECVLLSSGHFARNIGSDNEAPGGQVSWWWGSGGFAARGADLNVVFLNADNPLNWGSNNRGFNNQTLQLSSQYADRKVRISNNLDFGGSGRTVVVFENTDSTTDLAELSGTLFGTNPNDWLYKNGRGTLWLSGINSMQQGIIIDHGIIRADLGLGLRTNSRLRFRAGGQAYPNGVLETKGAFSRTLGDGNNQVRWEPWDRDGGFAARGGPLTVDIGGGGEIDIGSVEFLWRPRLVLGSWSADNEVDFVTDLNLRSEWNYVKVYDNTNSPNDRTVMSGNLRNGYLRVYGDGQLRLTGNNALRQLVIQDTASVLINATHTGSEWVWTENNHAARLGGSGTLTVPNMEIRNLGTLAPGDGAGTLTTAVSSGNGLYLLSGATYEWELGPGVPDAVVQTGNLRLDNGWTLTLLSLGGTPRASEQYDLFTYTGSFSGAHQPAGIDTNNIPADWVSSGVRIFHDVIGKRIYLTGLYSVLSVANDPVTDLTSSSATLHGLVSAQSDPLYVSVYWSTNDGGSDASAWIAGGFKADKGVFDNVVGQTLDHAIGGLQTNAQWYYTFNATNAAGTLDLWGAPTLSFTTLGPPVVVNSGVDDHSFGTARLNGAYADHNRGVVTLCWGESDAGMTTPGSWAYSTNIGLQAEATFAGTASQVLYGAQYVYRIYAENPYGSDWSDPATAFAPNFRPGRLPGTPDLQAWYEASTLTLGDGDPVLAWADSSTNGRDLVSYQGTPNFKATAINGHPAVNFDNESLQEASPRPYFAKEVYFVLRSAYDSRFGPDWGAPIGVKDGDDNDRMWMLQGNEDRFWADEIPGQVVRNGVEISPANNFDMAADMSAGMVLKVVIGPNSGTHVREMIVGSRTDAWSNSRFDTAEIIAYNANLSPEDENRIGAYLAAKYGISTAYTGGGNLGTPCGISNLRATDVGIGSGTMNANLRSEGAVYDVYVYWGTSDGGTGPGSWNLGSAFVATVSDAIQTVSHSIAPGAGSYWYTFMASNALDQIWASPSTHFTTVSGPAIHNTRGALTQTGLATLRGDLTAGVQADVRVYWGRTDGGTTPASWEHVVLMEDTPQGEFETDIIVGHGFEYTYRSFASNEAGQVWAGASTNFTMIRPLAAVLPVTDNLEAHYHTSAGVTTNASMIVSQWNDQSGNNRHATDNDNRQPLFEANQLNGLPTIQFNNQWLRVNHAMTEREAWVVFKSDNGPNFGPSWGTPWGAANNSHWMLEPGQKRFWTDGGQGQPPLAVWQNGIDRAPSPFELTDVDQFMILRVHERNAETTNMEIGRNPSWSDARWDTAEIIVFSQILSESDADKVGGYLSQKYGIASTYAFTYASDPALANNPVSNLSVNSATLNGTLESFGYSCDVYVYYGQTDGGTVQADWAATNFVGTFHSHTGAISFHATALALTSPYYYAFFATNMVVSAWAQPSEMFETVGPVTVSNESASNISETQATLRASLDGGGTGELRVYWGLSDGGTVHADWQHTNRLGDVLLGTYDTGVNVLAGAPYYYRAYATNDVSEDWADVSAVFHSTLPSVSLSASPGIAGFSPTNIPGCQAWYDASTLALNDGDPVTAWLDSSGHGRHLVTYQGLPNFKATAINGRPAVNFRSESLQEASPSPYLPQDVFLVFRSDSGNDRWGASWGAPVGVKDADDNNRIWMLEPGQKRFWGEEPPSGVTRNGVRISPANNFELAADLSQAMVLKVSLGPNSGTQIREMIVGSRMDGWGDGYYDTAEVIIYNRRLNANEENCVGAYLTAKYALTTLYPIHEKDGQATVTATLSNPSVSNVTVSFSFAGDAVKDTDYASSSDALVITAGTQTAGITLFGIDDTVQEEDETITVSILSLIHATNGSPFAASTPVTSDDPQIDNAGGAGAVTENAATLMGRLGMGDSAAATLFFGDNNGGTTAASWDEAYTLGVVSEDVTFSTNLTGLIANKTYYYRAYATNASWLAEDWADSSASFETALPSVSIADASVVEGDAGNVVATLTVSISTLSAVDVSVNYTTLDDSALLGADYVGTNGTLTIPALQPSATFTVHVSGDEEFEFPNESFLIDLSSPVLCTIADSQGVCTIIDDDAAEHLAAWNNWMPITFSGYAGTGTLTNWPALVRLGENIPAFRYDTFASRSGGDLRFAHSDGTRLLNFEIERWNESGESVVWVQVPELPAGGTTIWAYWGNPSATNLPVYATNGAAWNDGFRAVYHMGEILDRDASVRGHDAFAWEGTIVNVNGMIGKANDFTRNSRIRIPQSADFALPGQDYTMSAWIYTRDNSVHGIFGTYNQGFIFTVWDQWLAFHGDVQIAWGTRTTYVAPNDWHLVTVSRRGNEVRLYRDGILGQTISGGHLDITYAAQELVIGEAAPNHGWWMNGVIDEPRIEAKGRSADWIVASYSNQVQGSGFNTYGEIRGLPLLAIIHGATNITVNSAYATAQLSSTGGVPTATWLYWGLNDGGQDPHQWAFTQYLGQVAAVPTDYSRVIAPLTDGQSYTYAYAASNAWGMSWVSDTFYTLGRPIVNNGLGALPGEGFATLNGHLLSEGGPGASVYTYWGSSDGAGNKLAWDHVLANGSPGVGAFAADTPTALTYGIPYYYRTYATNGSGYEAWAPASESFGPMNPLTLAYSLKISFTNFAGRGTLTNFPALVKLDRSMTDGYKGFLKTDGYDLRFWTNNTFGGSELNYEIEHWDTNATSCIWVRIPALTHNLSIWASWGNHSLTNQEAYTTNGAVWNAEYIGVWHMNEASNATAAQDATIHNENATLTNMDPSGDWVPGHVAGALDFLGDNDYAETPLIVAQGSSAPPSVTMSAWAYPRTANADYEPVFATDNGGWDWHLGTDSGGKWEVFNGGGQAQSSLSFLLNQWQHIVAVFDKTAGHVKVYMNGVLSVVGGIDYDGSSAPLRIGGTAYGYFDGLIDEARISHTARSADWVWASWMNQGDNHTSFVDYGPVSPAGGVAIVNLDAIRLTTNTATLVGWVNATGAVYDVSVYWGASNGLNVATAWTHSQAFGTFAGAPPHTLLHKAWGLSPGVSYYYAFRATNFAADAWAMPSRQFITPLDNDEDGDGLPDVWEREVFGDTNVTSGALWQDWDGDGFNDRDEFTAGTLVTNSDSYFRLEICVTNGEVMVMLEGLEATGPGYDGLKRFYDMLQSTNLTLGPWQPIPEQTNLLGSGNMIMHTPPPGPVRVYQGKVRLE